MSHYSRKVGAISKALMDLASHIDKEHFKLLWNTTMLLEEMDERIDIMEECVKDERIDIMEEGDTNNGKCNCNGSGKCGGNHRCDCCDSDGGMGK